MKKQILALLIGSSLSLSAASIARTWVSAGGDNANDCSRTAPCKTFQGAYGKTLAGGEIDVLDSGDFGSLTISQDVTVDGGNNIASGKITVNSGHATIRNLSLFADGIAIWIKSGGSGVVENVVIQPDLTADDQLGTGISIQGTTSMQDVRVENAVTGVHVSNGVKAFLNHCFLVSDTTGIAIEGSATAQIDHSFIQYSHWGVDVSFDTPGTARLSDTTITDNTVGLFVFAPSAVVSFGNNRLFGNTTNGSQTLLTSQR